MLNALFGLSGRMRRRSFALWMLFTLVFSIVVAIAAGILGVVTDTDKSRLLSGPPAIILAPGMALLIWMQTALAAKRLHDAGRSGWYAAVLFILTAASTLLAFLSGGEDTGSGLPGIAYFALIGVLIGYRPSDGDNRFGPDPRRAPPRINIDPEKERMPAPQRAGAELAMEALIKERSGGRREFGRRAAT
jgi:uncharacterized membrane protein YhaH (DUF805 family)